MPRKNKKLSLNYWLTRSRWPAALLALALIVVAGLAWHWSGGNAGPATNTVAPASIAPSTQSTPSTNASTSTQNNSAKNTAPSQTSSGSPTSPDQSNYVSDYSPSSINEKEVSECVTTTDASCIIQFTMGSYIKPLPAKTVGANGVAIWYWTPKQYGLTGGSWKVSATASLNGQTKSSTSGILLQIP